jgi:hypothetical protein
VPQPPSRLSASLLVRKEDVPSSVKPPSVPPPPARISMTYRPRQDVHDTLKAIALDQRTSVQALIDEAVDRFLSSRVDSNYG